MAAILTDIFEAECELNHEEHEELTAFLAEFEMVLDGLTHTWDTDGRVSPTDQLKRLERKLSSELPRHFATEEKTVLASLGAVRPEMKPFCKAMKRQHGMLQRNFDKLKRMTEDLDYSPDLGATIDEIQKAGHQFSRQMLSHMNNEEKKLAEAGD